MKILQVPTRFYPFVGGVENYVRRLSCELVKRGYEVSIVCADEPDSSITEHEGMKIKRLSYLFKIANTNITLSLPYVLYKENFDVIHAHLPTPWSADWSGIISKLKRKPMVLTYHNDIVGEGFANYLARFYNATALKLLLRIAKRIIITRQDYTHYSPYLKGYESKIEVIPPGVDTNFFQPLNAQKEENTLFFLSSLNSSHKYKGLDYLLEAIAIVKKEIPNIKLVVGGEGSLLGYYKNTAASLGIAANVEFAGFIPGEKLPEYYNRCSAYVLPSVSPAQEGFGITLLEALACGKPVITTKITGAAKDVAGKNLGIVVEPQNSAGLANAIKKVLLESEDYNSKVLLGRNLIQEKYSWEKVAGEVKRVYEESLNL